MTTSPHFLSVMAERMRQLPNARHDPEPPPAGPPAAPEKKMLTLQEAADWVGVSLPTFQTWPIMRFKRGKVVRVSVKDLEAFIASQTAAADDNRPKKEEPHGQRGQ